MRFIFCFALFWSLTVEAQNSNWVIDLNKGKGSVEFSAIGNPSALKIHGKGAAPTGKILVSGDKTSGSIIFDLNSLDTGINLRNEHMKKNYLEISKFPTSKLEAILIKTPTLNRTFEQKSIPFQGLLTLHGITKPIRGIVNLKRSKKDIEGEAKFSIKVTDFGIRIPSFSEITMADHVDIVVDWAAPTKLYK